MKRVLILTVVVSFFITSAAWADTFGSGANQFQIEFVTIGQPGNAPDSEPRAAGAVGYAYRMGKYEISEEMIDKANALSAEVGAPLGITKDTRDPNKPATSITWFEAARFVNWLNTSTGSVPAYKLNASGIIQLWQPTDAGYDANNVVRNMLAKYFLPSVDEWYKAAYYDPLAGHYWDYPTGSDAVPDGIDFVGDMDFDAVFDDGADQLGPNDIFDVGKLSSYGTAAQGGNVYEWNELPGRGAIPSAPISGGSWESISFHLTARWSSLFGGSPSRGDYFVGFRVASVVPEPGAPVLLIVGFGAFWISPRHIH